ncbi:MAG: class I SAM-dependent methyltransferase [Elusimicrobia bacterium]|nr:class I SAM-dependent methyltransferase [Elusimicrobiota bacterium]
MSQTILTSTKWRDNYASPKALEYNQFIEMATMGHGRTLDALCAMMDRPAGEDLRILELGAGTGLLTKRLLERFSSALVVGIDGSREMLELALNKLALSAGRFKAVCSSFEEYPWHDEPEASYDFIVSAFSLHHLDHAAYPGLFSGLFRALKPDGELIVADYVLSSHRRWQNRYEEIWVETRMKQTNDALGLSLTKEQVRLENETRKRSEGDNPAPLESLLRRLSEAGFAEAECFWKHFCYAVYGARKMG